MEIPRRNLLQKCAWYLSLWGMYLKMYSHKLYEYRKDTIIGLVGGIVQMSSVLLFISVIYQRIPSLQGWHFSELLFILGFVTLGRELNRVFFDGPFHLAFHIRRGSLDTMLIRPASTLFQLVVGAQEMNAIGNALTGLFIMLGAASQLNLIWSPALLGFVLLALICNVLVVLSVLLLVGTLGFWVLESRSLLYPISWLYEFTRYPLGIFHPFAQAILTFVVPYAIASFYPAAYILRPDEFGWVPWAMPLATAGIFAAAWGFFRFGLARYTSVNG